MQQKGSCSQPTTVCNIPKVEFLDENQTKVSRVFLLGIQSHLYSFTLSFLFLQTHATTYSFYVALLYTVKDKGRKSDRKLRHFSNGLRNPYRNFKSENSQDYGQKPQRNCRFMNSASGFDPKQKLQGQSTKVSLTLK
jgi:hypothetical protein